MENIKLKSNKNKLSGVDIDTDLEITFIDNSEIVFITNYSDETDKVYRQIELDKRDAIDIAEKILKYYK